MTASNFITRSRCPICDSGEFKVIHNARFLDEPILSYLKRFYHGNAELEYLEGGFYTLCECTQCDAIFQQHILNEQLMNRLYGKWIDPEISLKKHNDRDNLHFYSYLSQEIMQVMSAFKKNQSFKTLDFGMGWAKWAIMAKSFNCDSYGCDISHEKINNAQKNGVKIIDFKDISGQEFDFVNTEMTFEHIPRPLEFARHLISGLKKGGVLKIRVPTDNRIHKKFEKMDWEIPKNSSKSLDCVAPLEHINFYRRKSFNKMAAILGVNEVFIPMMTQWRFSVDWNDLQRVKRNLLLPVYRNLLKKQNYIFLKK